MESKQKQKNENKNQVYGYRGQIDGCLRWGDRGEDEMGGGDQKLTKKKKKKERKKKRCIYFKVKKSV